MKPARWMVIGIICCLVVAGGSYFGATRLIDSLYAYRSPLRNDAPQPGASLGSPLTRRVVFVLIDALREDTSLQVETMPILNRFREQGAWATMHSRPPSYSEPGYSVLLTGAWPDLSDGPAINLDYEQIPTFTQDDIFSAAHRAGLKTAVSGYYWFEKLLPQAALDAGFYTPGEDRLADRAVVDAALPWLKDPSYTLVLIHLDQVDYAGHHEGGPRDPRWTQAAKRADDLLGEIAANLDLQRDTLLICSDHGQIDRGGHGGQDPITLVEPFILAGAGVRPGHNADMAMVDVAPTLAALLGVSLPTSGQGGVQTGMLALTDGQIATIRSAVAVQQAELLAAYKKAMHISNGEQASLGASTSVQAEIESLRASRLAGERLPRAVLAGVILIAILGWIIYFRSQTLPWLLSGAIVYAVLFHVKYTLIDGRTYSLSSISGATDLVVSTAVTVVITFGLASLTLGWILKRKSPAGSSIRMPMLGYTLVTLSLLMLPVLWNFVLNGPVITWTLPDFGASFLAVIAMIQMLIVAILGPVFTGLIALGSRLQARKSVNTR